MLVMGGLFGVNRVIMVRCSDFVPRTLCCTDEGVDATVRKEADGQGKDDADY